MDYQKLDLRELKALAKKGDAKAQNSLGVCYAKGEGVRKNLVKAIEWYTKAAEQGDPDAQHNLALCYERGDGVKKDYQKAFEWFSKAAEQGDEKAKYNLVKLGKCKPGSN